MDPDPAGRYAPLIAPPCPLPVPAYRSLPI